MPSRCEDTKKPGTALVPVLVQVLAATVTATVSNETEDSLSDLFFLTLYLKAWLCTDKDSYIGGRGTWHVSQDILDLQT